MIHFQGGRFSAGGTRTGLGRGFGGLLSYLAEGRRGAEEAEERVLHWGSQGFAQAIVESPNQRQLMARWMAITAAEAGIKEPVYHFGVSLAPGESLTSEQWDEVASRLLGSIGAQNHQAVWAVHKSAQEHLHIMVNRVAPDGTVLKTGRAIPPARKEVRRLEKDFGLFQVPEPAVIRRQGLSQGAHHEAKRTGIRPLSEQVREVLGELQKADGWKAMRRTLRSHGWELEPARGGRGVVVSDGRVRVSFSKVDRALSGHQLAERFGETYRDYLQRKRQVTRSPDPGLQKEPLAEDAGALEERARALLQKMGERQATFTDVELRRVTVGLQDAPALQEAVLQQVELVGLGKDAAGQQRYTTASYLENEYRMFGSAGELSQRAGKVLDPGWVQRELARTKLSAEQRKAVYEMVTSSDFHIVVGRAGVGKTRMTRELRALYEAQGFNVRGLAVAGRAAEGLQSESGIPSQTVASFEWALSKERDRLTAKDVVVVDEASMIDVPTLSRLLHHAEKSHAKVILVGDTAQYEPIGPGHALRGLEERFGASVVGTIRRQREDWARAASMRLADGDVAGALEAYQARGHVYARDTRQEAVDDLVKAYVRRELEDPSGSRIAIAYRNADVDAINAGIRAGLEEKLGASVRVGAIDVARGDRLLFTQNDRVGQFVRAEDPSRAGVQNGALGRVMKAKPDRVTVRLDDGREVSFSPEEYAHVRHGYAVTSHKSQGMTAGEVFMVPDHMMDAKSAYVTWTRHEHRLSIYWDRESFGSREGLGQVLSEGRVKDLAVDYAPGRPRALVLEDVREVLDDPVYEDVLHAMPEHYPGAREPSTMRQELENLRSEFHQSFVKNPSPDVGELNELSEKLSRIAHLERQLNDVQRIRVPQKLERDLRNARKAADSYQAVVADREAAMNLRARLARELERTSPTAGRREELERNLRAVDLQLARHREEHYRFVAEMQTRALHRDRSALRRSGGGEEVVSFHRRVESLYNYGPAPSDRVLQGPGALPALKEDHARLTVRLRELRGKPFDSAEATRIYESTLREALQVRTDHSYLEAVKSVQDLEGQVRVALAEPRPSGRREVEAWQERLDDLVGRWQEAQGEVAGRQDLRVVGAAERDSADYWRRRVAQGDSSPGVLEELRRRVESAPTPDVSPSPLFSQRPEVRLEEYVKRTREMLDAHRALQKVGGGAPSPDLARAVRGVQVAEERFKEVAFAGWARYREATPAQVQEALQRILSGAATKTAVSKRATAAEQLASFVAYSAKRQVSPGRLQRQLLGRLTFGILPIPTTPLGVAFKALGVAHRVVKRTLVRSL